MIKSDAQFQLQVQRIFQTEDGQDVLDELEKRYCRSTYDDNPYRMGYNCGKSDLIMLIKQLTEEQPDERSGRPEHAAGGGEPIRLRE